MAIDRVSNRAESAASFFWYDLETTGTDPRSDRIVQFAGIRTDLELNEVGSAFNTYVKCPVDVLPDPAACAVTGLTPQRVNRDGMNELEAYVAMNRCFAQPQTCVAGYNSLRFDDEFVRHGFFRHFIDPYAREWQGGNSRWDIIDLARAAAALRPEGIAWPTEEGLPTFRLGELADANGIAHRGAHDALSDVRATLDLARLLRDKQPRLFAYYLKLRDRGELQRRLRPERSSLSLHVSRMFARERNCIAPIIPLAWHPRNRYSVIVADVGRDVRPLIEWDVDRLRDALFGTHQDERPPLKEVRFNRCPFVAPLATLRPQDALRLKLDVAAAQRRADDLHAAVGMAEKVAALYGVRANTAAQDADASIYDGFIDDVDRVRCGEAISQMLDGVASPSTVFSDARLNELLFRMRARRDESMLSAPELTRWRAWMRSKLIDGGDTVMTLAKFRRFLAELDAPAELIADLHAHANWIERRVSGPGASVT